MPMKTVDGQYGDWNDEESRWNSTPSPVEGGATNQIGSQLTWNKDARNQVRNDWMGSSGSLQDFVNNSPYKDHLKASDDILSIDQTPDDKYQWGPEQIDAVIDYGQGGTNKHAWTGIGPGSGGSGPGGSLTSADRAAGPGGSMGGGVVGSFGSPQAQQLFDLLMKRAQMSENIDPNDPIIKAQTDAFRAEGNQARRDFLSSQAERSGPYGNLQSESRRSAEELGKSVGGFQGQAMQNELAARRQEIEHALSGAAGFLTQQQQMALQSELHKLDLTQQESQFGRSLAQNAYQFDTNRFDNIFA